MSLPAFDLQAGSITPDQLFVTAFEATEGISRPFRLEVQFFPLNNEPLDVKSLIGQEAVLRVPAPSGDRSFHGEIHAVRAMGEGGGRLRYVARIGPKAARLDHIRRSRIFQAKDVTEVVKAVLDGGGVTLRMAASASYPKLDFCVQYRESDLAFISRLLERDGLFYFFEHTDSAHTLVVGDASSAFPPIEGDDALPFRPMVGAVGDAEHVFDVTEIHRLRSDKVSVRDFDPLRPALEVSGEEESEAKALELYDYPAEVVNPSEAAAVATARLQERRQGKLTLDARTHSPRLFAGALFKLTEHPDDAFNRKLLVVEVRHRGQRREALGEPEEFWQTYQNEIRCLPADTPYRSPHRTPRPKIAGLQTAIVTGAAGEEIHPDEHARVKVQFHWDREGAKDDKSSCWIRVAQSWAGAGFGANFLPRIGQEVLVRFMEGNPDRPLICGAVYNGEQPPAASLPGQKTQSALQSSSSPGNSGSNEMRFEDAAREELIRLHAQKDLTLATLNDKAQEVRQDESLEVKRNRTREIGRDQSHEITRTEVTEVTKNHDLTVMKSRSAKVTLLDKEKVVENRTETVSGALNESTKSNSLETVGMAKSTTVGAANFVLVGTAYSIGVGLARAETVAGSRSEILKGSRDERVEKNRTAKVVGEDHQQTEQGMTTSVGKDAKVEVDGNFELGVKEPIAYLAKKVEMKADSKLNLIVGGKLILTIDSGGKVKINPATITVEGS